MLSKFIPFVAAARAAQASLTVAEGADTSATTPASPDLALLAPASRFDPMQLDGCVWFEQTTAGSTDLSVTLTLDSAADITTVHLLGYLNNGLGTAVVTVGEEECYTFPAGVQTEYWTYLDCSGVSAATDTVTITKPYDAEADTFDLVLCGAIVDTDDAADYYEYFNLSGYDTIAGMDRSPSCGDYASEPDYDQYMLLEAYLEETDTAGSYYLKHVCSDDDAVYTLSVRDGVSLADNETSSDACFSPLDWDCSVFSSDEAATPVEFELVNIGDLDTFYMYLDYPWNGASLGFQQNLRDFTELRALADSSLQDHLGCFSTDIADGLSDKLYGDFFQVLRNGDLLVTDCLDFLQVSGFKYAALTNGYCYGMREDKAEEAGLADLLADEANLLTAEDCDMPFYYEEFNAALETPMTFGSADNWDVYELSMPVVEVDDDEEEEELSATGYALGIATAAIASALVM